MSDKCNQKVEELTTDSKNGFSFKVKKKEELNKTFDTKKSEVFYEITFNNFYIKLKELSTYKVAKSIKNLKIKNPKKRVPFHRK